MDGLAITSGMTGRWRVSAAMILRAVSAVLFAKGAC